MVHSASESYSSRYTADNNKILYNGVCSSGKFFTRQINLKFQTSTTIFWCAVILIFGGSKIDLHMVVSFFFISMPTCNINHPLILLLCVSQSVSSVSQFSCSVVSNFLWPHESQHARPPCPSPSPGVYTNSCPSSWRRHPAISSSVVPFFSCPQALPASGSFPMSQFSQWGGQSTGVSASTSGLPMNTQDWSPLGWTGWISLQSRGLSRVFSSTTVH